MKAVLDEVGRRLLDADESTIRIPEICEATGVNYGSVYHHFGSREGVIDTAYNMLFLQFAEDDLDALRQVSETANSLDEYIAGLWTLVGRFSSGPDRQRRRAMRIRIAAASLTRPELRRVIGETQTRLTTELMRIVRYGQDRGWLRRDVTTRSIAVMLQALLVGRVIDDISTEPINSAEWELSMAILFISLLNQEK
jgi:AcrR family transcriptional regulator